MGEVINIDNTNIEVRNQCELVAVSENMLAEVRNSLNSSNTLSVPIAQIATLGAGVSSLLPSLRTVTQTMTTNLQIKVLAIS